MVFRDKRGRTSIGIRLQLRRKRHKNKSVSYVDSIQDSETSDIMQSSSIFKEARDDSDGGHWFFKTGRQRRKKKKMYYQISNQNLKKIVLVIG